MKRGRERRKIRLLRRQDPAWIPEGEGLRLLLSGEDLHNHGERQTYSAGHYHFAAKKEHKSRRL